MKSWISALIIFVILVGSGYVLRYCTENPQFPTEVPSNDTTYIYGDTLLIPTDTVYVVIWKKIPAVTTVDSTGMVAKSVSKDTLLVMDKDSIKVKATADYYPSEDNFDLGIDIDYRGYDAVVTDTIKINNYIPVEVEVDEPFYDEFVWGMGVTAIVVAVVALIFGG